MNKWERKLYFQKNKGKLIKRGTIALSVLLLVVGVIYITYSKFESNKEFTLINGKVVDNGDIKIVSYYWDSEKKSSAPDKANGYYFNYYDCGNTNVSVSWNDSNWSITFSNFVEPVKCTLYFVRDIEIEFDGNGGTVSSNKETYTYTPTATYGNLPTAEKDDLFFVGWYTEPEGGNIIRNTSNIDKNIHKLYAHYKENSAFVQLTTLLNKQEFETVEDFMANSSAVTSLINNTQAKNLLLSNLADDQSLATAFVDSDVAMNKFFANASLMKEFGANNEFLKVLKANDKYHETYVPTLLASTRLTNAEKLQYGYPVYAFNEGTSNTDLWNSPTVEYKQSYPGNGIYSPSKNNYINSTIYAYLRNGAGTCSTHGYWSSKTVDLSKYINIAFTAELGGDRGGLVGLRTSWNEDLTTCVLTTDGTSSCAATQTTKYVTLQENKKTGRIAVYANLCFGEDRYATSSINASKIWIE